MLEKFVKKYNFDAHFHYAQCINLGICSFSDDLYGISCAHSVEEWKIQQTAPTSVIQSYGIHPQLCAKVDIQKETDFLEQLLSENKITLIGETGFDFFTDDFKSTSKKQEEVWGIQLELAKKYCLPLVIHCRKANQKLFEYSTELSKLPEVLFHSFMGSDIECQSLLNRGINGYFSFGKQIFNNNKNVLKCIKNLPTERLLAETDAPFQYLKNEKFTTPNEITKIKMEINRIKKIDKK